MSRFYVLRVAIVATSSSPCQPRLLRGSVAPSNSPLATMSRLPSRETSYCLSFWSAITRLLTRLHCGTSIIISTLPRMVCRLWRIMPNSLSTSRVQSTIGPPPSMAASQAFSMATPSDKSGKYGHCIQRTKALTSRTPGQTRQNLRG